MCFHCVYLQQKSQWQEWILTLFLVPQRKKFVFQLVPTGTPMKVPMFMRLPKQSKHIQEETSPLVSQTHWTGLANKKKLSCDVHPFLFPSLSFCLASCLPLSFFEYTHSWVHFMGKTWIELPIKTIFLWEYCSHYDHINDALYIFNLDILFHIITPESFSLALCCIFHSTRSFVMIFRNNHVCLPFVQTTNSWKRRIFSDLFKWGRSSCRLVNWCNKMMLCGGWRLPHDVQKYLMCLFSNALMPHNKLERPKRGNIIGQGSTFLYICSVKFD